MLCRTGREAGFGWKCGECSMPRAKGHCWVELRRRMATRNAKGAHPPSAPTRLACRCGATGVDPRVDIGFQPGHPAWRQGDGARRGAGPLQAPPGGAREIADHRSDGFPGDQFMGRRVVHSGSVLRAQLGGDAQRFCRKPEENIKGTLCENLSNRNDSIIGCELWNLLPRAR